MTMTNSHKMSAVFIGGLLLTALVMFLISYSRAAGPEQPNLRNGDIIFQSLNSSAGEAICLATNSRFSHCGILFNQNNTWYVYEAIGPVKLTPLQEWVDRGIDREFEIKRLRNADQVLTQATLDNMLSVGRQFNGKEYDPQFRWSDARIYCSELVWKIYQRGAGIMLGNLQALRDYNLDHNTVREAMQQRYGDSPPLEELMVAPQTIYDCDELETVAKS